MPKAKRSAALKAKLKNNRRDLLQSCRLCGIIGGNRVPIIQETITIGDDTCIDESNEIQINKKIQDCLSIEVKYGDNLPSLICIICLDKVNDFYEFRIMCAETNIRLHKALGISIDKPQPVGMVVSSGNAENELDCILGVAGPVFFQPSSSSTTKEKAVEKKVTPLKKENKIKYKKVAEIDEDDDKPLIKRLKMKNETLGPILEVKRPNKRERNRNRKLAVLEKYFIKKKMALALKNNKTTTTNTDQNIKKVNKKKLPYNCKVCSERFGSSPLLRTHQLELHVPRIFQFGCIPCKEGFQNFEDYTKHHNWHKQNSVTYNCSKCSKIFKTYRLFICHFDRNQCIVEYKKEEFICHKCNKNYDSKYLLSKHDCVTPTSSCQFCGKEFLKSRLVKSHEKYCEFSHNIIDYEEEQIPRKILKRSAKRTQKDTNDLNPTVDTREILESHNSASNNQVTIKSEQVDEHESVDRIFFKPSLKLKIKKEHGTLNSTIVEDGGNLDNHSFDQNMDPVTPRKSTTFDSTSSNYMCEISATSYNALNERNNDNYLTNTVSIKSESLDSENVCIENASTDFVSRNDDSQTQYSQMSRQNSNKLPVITSTVSLNPSAVHIKSEPNINISLVDNENEFNRTNRRSHENFTENNSMIQVKLESDLEVQNRTEISNENIFHDMPNTCSVLSKDTSKESQIYIKLEPVESQSDNVESDITYEGHDNEELIHNIKVEPITVSETQCNMSDRLSYTERDHDTSKSSTITSNLFALTSDDAINSHMQIGVNSTNVSQFPNKASDYICNPTCSNYNLNKQNDHNIESLKDMVTENNAGIINSKSNTTQVHLGNMSVSDMNTSVIGLDNNVSIDSQQSTGNVNNTLNMLMQIKPDPDSNNHLRENEIYINSNFNTDNSSSITTDPYGNANTIAIAEANNSTITNASNNKHIENILINDMTAPANMNSSIKTEIIAIQESNITPSSEIDISTNFAISNNASSSFIDNDISDNASNNNSNDISNSQNDNQCGKLNLDIQNIQYETRDENIIMNENNPNTSYITETESEAKILEPVKDLLLQNESTGNNISIDSQIKTHESNSNSFCEGIINEELNLEPPIVEKSDFVLLEHETEFFLENVTGPELHLAVPNESEDLQNLNKDIGLAENQSSTSQDPQFCSDKLSDTFISDMETSNELKSNSQIDLANEENIVLSDVPQVDSNIKENLFEDNKPKEYNDQLTAEQDDVIDNLQPTDENMPNADLPIHTTVNSRLSVEHEVETNNDDFAIGPEMNIQHNLKQLNEPALITSGFQDNLNTENQISNDDASDHANLLDNIILNSISNIPNVEEDLQQSNWITFETDRNEASCSTESKSPSEKNIQQPNLIPKQSDMNAMNNFSEIYNIVSKNVDKECGIQKHLNAENFNMLDFENDTENGSTANDRNLLENVINKGIDNHMVNDLSLVKSNEINNLSVETDSTNNDLNKIELIEPKLQTSSDTTSNSNSISDLLNKEILEDSNLMSMDYDRNDGDLLENASNIEIGNRMIDDSDLQESNQLNNLKVESDATHDECAAKDNNVEMNVIELTESKLRLSSDTASNSNSVSDLLNKETLQNSNLVSMECNRNDGDLLENISNKEIDNHLVDDSDLEESNEIIALNVESAAANEERVAAENIVELNINEFIESKLQISYDTTSNSNSVSNLLDKEILEDSNLISTDNDKKDGDLLENASNKGIGNHMIDDSDLLESNEINNLKVESDAANEECVTKDKNVQVSSDTATNSNSVSDLVNKEILQNSMECDRNERELLENISNKGIDNRMVDDSGLQETNEINNLNVESDTTNEECLAKDNNVELNINEFTESKLKIYSDTSNSNSVCDLLNKDISEDSNLVSTECERNDGDLLENVINKEIDHMIDDSDLQGGTDATTEECVAKDSSVELNINEIIEPKLQISSDTSNSDSDLHECTKINNLKVETDAINQACVANDNSVKLNVNEFIETKLQISSDATSNSTSVSLDNVINNEIIHMIDDSDLPEINEIHNMKVETDSTNEEYVAKDSSVELNRNEVFESKLQFSSDTTSNSNSVPDLPNKDVLQDSNLMSMECDSNENNSSSAIDYNNMTEQVNKEFEVPNLTMSESRSQHENILNKIKLTALEKVVCNTDRLPDTQSILSISTDENINDNGKIDKNIDEEHSEQINFQKSDEQNMLVTDDGSVNETISNNSNSFNNQGAESSSSILEDKMQNEQNTDLPNLLLKTKFDLEYEIEGDNAKLDDNDKIKVIDHDGTNKNKSLDLQCDEFKDMADEFSLDSSTSNVFDNSSLLDLLEDKVEEHPDIHQKEIVESNQDEIQFSNECRIQSEISISNTNLNEADINKTAIGVEKCKVQETTIDKCFDAKNSPHETNIVIYDENEDHTIQLENYLSNSSNSIQSLGCPLDSDSKLKLSQHEDYEINIDSSLKIQDNSHNVKNIHQYLDSNAAETDSSAQILSFKEQSTSNEINSNLNNDDLGTNIELAKEVSNIENNPVSPTSCTYDTSDKSKQNQ